MQHWTAALLLPTALLVPAASQAAVIDDFSVPQQAIDTDATPGGVSDSSAFGASILGGQRDINADTINVSTFSNQTTVNAGSGVLDFSTDALVTGTGLIQWDGADQSSALDATGLGGIDLTEGGTVGLLSLQILFAQPAPGFRFTIEAYSDAGNYTIIELQAPEILSGPAPVSLPLDLFQNCGAAPASLGSVDLLSVSCSGSGVDLSNLGALQVRLNTGPTPTTSLDVTLGEIATVQTEAAIGDRVWEDLNGNGIQDAGEPGMAGITVNLYSCDDVLLDSTSTDFNGNYLFSSLTPGDYYVEFVAPAGYSFTGQNVGNDNSDSDADPLSGRAECTTLVAGETDRSWDAGLYRPASLGDYVWDDLDQDGIQDDDEFGIPGVTVRLWNCDATENLATVSTDGDGAYQFDNLAPGSYRVEFVLPDGYNFSPQFQGGIIQLDSNANPANGMSECIELESGDNNTTIDAGMYEPVTATAELGDYVWHDLNANGIQDASEPGVAGVIVELFDCSGTPVATTVTDASGLYLFTELEAGDYRVHFNLPAGFDAFTGQDLGGDDARDSDADSNGDSGCITLSEGESNRTIDAGVYQLAALGDYVWEDLNRNGLQDDGATGMGGVEARLYRCDAPTEVVASTFTDGNGFYLFSGLTPDQYFVEFVSPAGYSFSARNQGADDSLDSDANSSGVADCVTLSSGETNLTVDAGLYVPANPAIDIEKHTNGHDADTPTGPILAVGDTVVWKYFVTNTGNVDLVNVSVTDDQGVSVSCPSDVLAAGATMTCHASGIAEAGQYANIGTATGHSVFDNSMVTDSDPSHYFAELCGLTVTKTASPDTITGGGDYDKYDGCYKDRYGRYICDGNDDKYGHYKYGHYDNCYKDRYGRYVCDGSKDDGYSSHSSYESNSCYKDKYGRYICESYNDGCYKNKYGRYICDKDYSNGGDTGACPTGSTEVTYTYVISNLGSALNNVLVSDDKLGMISFPSQLASGASKTVTETACISETTTNVVTVTGKLPSGTMCSATDSATVTVETGDKDGCYKNKYGRYICDANKDDGYNNYDGYNKYDDGYKSYDSYNKYDDGYKSYDSYNKYDDGYKSYDSYSRH